MAELAGSGCAERTPGRTPHVDRRELQLPFGITRTPKETALPPPAKIGGSVWYFDHHDGAVDGWSSARRAAW